MQQQSARHNSLQGEVFTATPQKLQLLLIEAAIKNIHRTKQAWTDLRFDDGFESLTRSQDIIAEILCSLDVENNPAIAKKLASIYIFIFRRLAEGGMEHSQEKLDDALRVLNSERETWKLVCEKFGSSMTQADGASAPGTQGIRSTSAAAFTPSAAPSTGSGTKILVSSATPKPMGTTPLATPTPLAADGTAKPAIPKPPASGGYYTAGMSPLGKPSNLSTSQPPKPTPPPKSPPSAAGNNWDA